MSVLSWLFGSATVDVTAAELEQRLARGDKPVLVDVRTPGEYAGGHIRGAILLPLDELAQRADSLDPTREIVLICRSGNRSSQAYRYLESRGFTRLRNLAGGMVAWRGAVVRK